MLLLCSKNIEIFLQMALHAIEMLWGQVTL